VKKDRSEFWKSDGTRSVLASLISILIGMLVGSIIIIVVGLRSGSLSLSSAWEGIRIVFAGIFATGRDAAGNLTFGYNPVSMGNLLFRAAPLILTGLSVAIAFKTGLFNIGAPGQYLAGTAATLFIALSIPTSSVPAGLVWLLAFLGGCAAGALWGAIPGLVKAFLNINEVLACIMTNWIAANLVTWAFDASNLKNVAEYGKTGYVYKTTYNGVATAKLGLDKLFPGSQVNAGILIAILLAVLVYILMNKTTLGFELKACGANRHAARYAGIRDKRNIVLSMAIAGGLAGAGGALYYLSGNTEFFWSTYQALPAIGFNGIPVALLAVNNPIAVVFTGLFMSALDIAGQQLTSLTAYNEYITNVIISVIVYLSAFSLVIKMWISGSRKHRREKAEKEAAAVETAAETGSSAVTAPASEAEAAAETQPPAAETPESPAVPAADAIDEKGDEE
jgi:simple sugar transport system permease protein